MRVCFSHRWAESATVPDIVADLQRVHKALGISSNQRVDFILIRDDMVAREVTIGAFPLEGTGRFSQSVLSA